MALQFESLERLMEALRNGQIPQIQLTAFTSSYIYGIGTSLLLLMEISMTNRKLIRKDHLRHGLIFQGNLRVAICDVTDSVKVAQSKHNLDPLSTIALGRMFAGAALMGSGLKNEDAFLQIRFDGNGPLGGLVAEHISPHYLRGFAANPRLDQVLEQGQELPQSIGEAVGKGNFHIKIGRKNFSEAYHGICEIKSGEIAEDLASYYLESEQIPSLVSAGVQLDQKGQILAAGGLLIQKVGGGEISDDLLESLEQKIQQNPMTQLLAHGEKTTSILAEITGLTMEEVTLHCKPLSFQCFCSRKRMAEALQSLGELEIHRIAAKSGTISTHCHFCTCDYVFTKEELLKVGRH